MLLQFLTPVLWPFGSSVSYDESAGSLTSPTNSHDPEKTEEGSPTNEGGHSQALEQTTDTHIESDTETPLIHKKFRSLPIISCIFVPFSILLAIPSLTERWYIRTDDEHNIIEYEENPMFLNISNGISLGCAILANVCLLVRLGEKMVKRMTFFCILLFSFHDFAAIAIIIFFIVKTQEDDGFILGQAFWMTVCSTISSVVTNCTLIVDYKMTRDLEKSGSGLTKKQRSLTIIVIILLFYLAVGAAINTALMSLSFVDALYFSIVCIETIGFGDINPLTPGARLFSTVYTVVGIILLTIAIGLIRESLQESIQVSLHAKMREERTRRIRKKWICALQWRLQQLGLPVWVDATEEWETKLGTETNDENRDDDQLWTRLNQEEEEGQEEDVQGPDMDTKESNAPFRQLNIQALNNAQLRAAAMEAGAPLDKLLHNHLFHVRRENSRLVWRKRKERGVTGERKGIPISPTHHRLGRMIMVLGNFAVAVGVGPAIAKHGNYENVNKNDLENGKRETVGTAGREQAQRNKEPQFQERKMESNNLTRAEFEHLEIRMFNVRLAIALVLFFTFWLGGAAIFTATEGWTFSLALYFCFITFTTVGYGDPVPRTPAGRSVFVGWALLGVGTMTILISSLADRFSDGYKNMIASSESTTTSYSSPASAALSSSGVPQESYLLSGTKTASGSEFHSTASSGSRMLSRTGVTSSSGPVKTPSTPPVPIRSRPSPFPEHMGTLKERQEILDRIDSLRTLTLSANDETDDKIMEQRFTRVEDELKTLLGLMEHQRRGITM